VGFFEEEPNGAGAKGKGRRKEGGAILKKGGGERRTRKRPRRKSEAAEGGRAEWELLGLRGKDARSTITGEVCRKCGRNQR